MTVQPGMDTVLPPDSEGSPNSAPGLVSRFGLVTFQAETTWGGRRFVSICLRTQASTVHRAGELAGTFDGSVDTSGRSATPISCFAAVTIWLIGLGTDGADTDAAAIVKWARSGGRAEFSRRECQKAMEGRFRNLERLTKALQRLEQNDVLRLYTKRNKGAPSTEMCLLNPKLLST